MLIHVPLYFPYTFTGEDFANYLAEHALVTLESYFSHGNTHDVLVTTNHSLAYQMFWDYRRVSGRKFELIFVTRRDLVAAFGCDQDRLDDDACIKMLFSKFFPIVKGFDDRIVHVDLDTLFTKRVDFAPLFAGDITLVDANRFLPGGAWAPEPATARFFGIDLGRMPPAAKWLNSGVFAVRGRGFDLCRQETAAYLRKLDQANSLVGCTYPDEFIMNALALREAGTVKVIPDHTYNFLVYFLINDRNWLRNCQILHFHALKPAHTTCVNGQIRYQCLPEHAELMSSEVYRAMALYFWHLHAACRGLDYPFMVRDKVPWNVVESEYRRLVEAHHVSDDASEAQRCEVSTHVPVHTNGVTTNGAAAANNHHDEGDVRFFAWSHARSPELDLLMRSSRRHEVAVEILGLDMDNTDLLFKIASLHRATSSLPDHTLVVCSDGFDVLYTQGVKFIRRKFRAFHAPMVFSAERHYSHQLPEHRAHYESTGNGSPYRYLNTGCLVGYAKAIHDMLAVVLSYDARSMRERLRGGRFCDQTLISKYVVDHPETVALDHGCDLFWCVAGEWDTVSNVAAIEHSGLFNTNTGTFPALVHVPYRERYGHVLDYLARGLGYA